MARPPPVGRWAPTRRGSGRGPGAAGSTVRRSPAGPSRRHGVVPGLEPERPGQPAAARLRLAELDPHLPQQLLLVLLADDRLVVAVDVDEGLPADAGRLPPLRVPVQELAQVERLFAEPLR